MCNIAENVFTYLIISYFQLEEWEALDKEQLRQDLQVIQFILISCVTVEWDQKQVTVSIGQNPVSCID